MTLAQANDDIARMIPLIVKQFPLMPGLTQEMWDAVGLAPNVRPLSEAVIGEMSRPLWILLGTVGIVLLMAWTNVANLLLVRAEGRQREFAVRGALGASRGRIAAELLSESLMLGLAGGALGVVFAQAGIGLLRRMAPVALPRVDDIGIDGVVLLVTLTISVVTSLLFGLVPVVRFGALNVEALKDAGRSASDAPGATPHAKHAGRGTGRARAGAVGGLGPDGSDVRRHATGSARLRPARGGADVRPRPASGRSSAIAQQVAQTYEQIAERLKQVPGVAAVGLGIDHDGRRRRQGSDLCRGPTCCRPASDPFGQVDRARILRDDGQPRSWPDARSRGPTSHQLQPVVLISENLAREYWETPAKAVGQADRHVRPKGPGRRSWGSSGTYVPMA